MLQTEGETPKASCRTGHRFRKAHVLEALDIESGNLFYNEKLAG